MLIDDILGKFAWTLEGVAITSKRKREEELPRNYAALLEYCKEHGTCNVPYSVVYECNLPSVDGDGGTYRYKSKLGQWLIINKRAKKGVGRYTITPEHEAQLQLLVDQGNKYSFCISFFMVHMYV